MHVKWIKVHFEKSDTEVKEPAEKVFFCLLIYSISMMRSDCFVTFV